MTEGNNGSGGTSGFLVTASGRDAWLAASVEVGQQVLDPSRGVGPVVQDILEHVLELSRARTVTFVGPSQQDDADFEVRVAAGAGSQPLLRKHYPKQDTLEGLAMQENRGLLTTAAAGPCHHQQASFDQPVGPLLAVPFNGPEDAHGAIVASRAAGQPPFNEAELAMTEDFARHASVVLQLTDAQAAREQLRFREQHDTRTRQLHDDLIQDLFSLGVTLKSHQAADGQTPAQGAVLQDALDKIDAVIARLRVSLTSAPDQQS